MNGRAIFCIYVKSSNNQSTVSTERLPFIFLLFPTVIPLAFWLTAFVLVSSGSKYSFESVYQE